MMFERDPLEDLLGSVSDGRPVDWDTVSSGGLAPAERTRIENLRDVSRIADFNRDLQRSGGAGPGVVDAVGSGQTAGTPERWGDLLLLELIGRGAHADVFRAWDPRLQREVALKLLRSESRGAAAETIDSPLLEEGRAAARIRHPHVVAVHGIDRHDGRVGLWMELVRGTTLEQEIRSRGPLAPDDAVRLGIEIGSALAAVHAGGLLHRDVKPANIVRDADGRFVLADFGLGMRWDEIVTTTAWPTGTPMYMAPEVLVGAPASARADVYSLGLTLWFALAGRHPFDVSTIGELRAAAATGPSQALHEARPDLPASLVATVLQALAPAPELRYAGVQDLVDALRACRGEEERAVDARSTSRVWRRVASLATLAAVLVAAGLWTTRGSQRPSPKPEPTSGVAPSPATASGTAAADYDVEASFLRRNEGAMTRLLPGDRVAPGDRLSLEVRATRPAWVYVLDEDEHGERYLLFPQPMFDTHNPLPADSTMVLPGTIGARENAWTVTSRGGRETFLVVVSPDPLPELEADLGTLAAPEPGKPIAYASVSSTSMQRLRGVGGLSELPPDAAHPSAPSLAFDRFRALAGRESGVHGVWVRQIILENPL